MAIPDRWTEFSQADDWRKALREHLGFVLATEDEGKTLLDQVIAKARSMEIVEEQESTRLVINFEGDVMIAYPSGTWPRPDAACVTFTRFLDAFAQLVLEDAQIDLRWESGIEDEGWLDGTELDGRTDVMCPMRVYSDVYVYHPERKTPDGEPILCLLDHEVVEDEGPQPVTGHIGTVFLRHVSEALKR